MTSRPQESSAAVVHGRDHDRLGDYVVESIGGALAVGITPGARPKSSVDANEDVGAIVNGPRASLLVVADGHFGCEASELAVERVLTQLGDDPPPADLSDEALTSLFFEAGIAIQRGTTRPDARNPRSRTTLAIALMTDDTVQWASLGDSCIVLARPHGVERLDHPRSAYLGYRFTSVEVASLTARGVTATGGDDCVILATDGLVTALESGDGGVERAVGADVAGSAEAADLTEALLRRAVAAHVADAVTVAVARPHGASGRR